MGAAIQVQSSDQPAAARRRCSGRKCSRCWMWCAVPALLLVFAGIFYWDQTTGEKPDYSMAIDSVSGLDPTADLGRRSTLDPVFNITVRVASDKLWARECAAPGLYVEVSYRGILLATSVTTTEEVCAGPKKEVDRSLVARGTGVVVSGSVLDSLARDMRLEAQVFDVMLRGWRNDVVSSCMAMRVDSIPVPC